MTSSRLSDVERELNDLRARAYGPNRDIEADPAAMARLIELEAAHGAAAGATVKATASAGSGAADASPTTPPAHEGVGAGSPVPQENPLIPTPSQERFGPRTWLLVGSTVIIAMLVYAATWLHVPQADATLQPTAGETDDVVIRVLDGDVEVPDISTLRQFDQYHDVNVWSVENSFGETCLVAWDFEGGRFQFECSPPGIELALHMGVVAEPDDGFGDWLPVGSVVSLHLRENTVDVFVHPPPPIK